MKLPLDVIQLIENSMEDMKFGSVTLYAKLHDGQPKYRITKEISIVPNKPTSGGNEPSIEPV